MISCGSVGKESTEALSGTAQATPWKGMVATYNMFHPHEASFRNQKWACRAALYLTLYRTLY